MTSSLLVILILVVVIGVLGIVVIGSIVQNGTRRGPAIVGGDPLRTSEAPPGWGWRGFIGPWPEQVVGSWPPTLIGRFYVLPCEARAAK